MSKATVVTATTGRKELQACIDSVAAQTFKDVDHLIFSDGDEAFGRVLEGHLEGRFTLDSPRCNLIALPYSVGNNQWNAHRIYGASAYFAQGDYIMFLDDDNTIDPEHIEQCLKICEDGAPWSYSLRKIVNKEGFLFNDDCESLGKWPSVLHEQDYFIDVNCYFMPKILAVQISPLWYRKFRQPGQPEVDRVLCHALRQIAPNFECTYQYTVNYLVASNSEMSVKPEFFQYGNAEMLTRYNGVLPWKK